MRQTIQTLAVLLMVLTGCTVATRVSDDDDLFDADEPPLSPELVYETCELDDTEGLAPEAFVIQIRNRECSTAICAHFHQETFCTRLCEHDDDCTDLGRGLCELEIFVGDSEFIGTYCVPLAVSD